MDDEDAAGRLREFLAAGAPRLVATRVELYRDPEPIFERFGIEAEIEGRSEEPGRAAVGRLLSSSTRPRRSSRSTSTPARFVGKEDLEETVFATNLEAIPEVARQIRLRDLGGLLVVDFIDMHDPEHRREVFERFESGARAGPRADARCCRSRTSA